MIYLDTRIGSADLRDHFLCWKVPHEMKQLKFGDASWEGNGPEGLVIPVGVEIKTISECLGEMCGRSNRFLGYEGQLEGLLKTYQAIWLIVQGQYSCDYQTGLVMHKEGKETVPLEIAGRRFMYRDLDGMFTTLESKTPVHIRRTISRPETARVIADLHYWWTHKAWEQHRSHLRGSFPLPPGATILLNPDHNKQVRIKLPHIGYEKSRMITDKFPTVLDLAASRREDWLELDGIGEKTANDVVDSLRKRRFLAF